MINQYTMYKLICMKKIDDLINRYGRHQYVFVFFNSIKTKFK